METGRVRAINIVGSGPSWPYFDKTIPSWCTSTVYERLREHTSYIEYVFQLHNENLFESWIPSLLSRAVIMRPSKKAPDATVLCAEEMVKDFGPRFASTIAWMLGMVITTGAARKVYLHGVDMKSSSEYGEQRETFFYMAGVARGFGIDVVIPNYSGVYMKDITYGWKGE